MNFIFIIDGYDALDFCRGDFCRTFNFIVIINDDALDFCRGDFCRGVRRTGQIEGKLVLTLEMAMAE